MRMAVEAAGFPGQPVAAADRSFPLRPEAP